MKALAILATVILASAAWAGPRVCFDDAGLWIDGVLVSQYGDTTTTTTTTTTSTSTTAPALPVVSNPGCFWSCPDWIHSEPDGVGG